MNVIDVDKYRGCNVGAPTKHNVYFFFMLYLVRSLVQVRQMIWFLTYEDFVVVRVPFEVDVPRKRRNSERIGWLDDLHKPKSRWGWCTRSIHLNRYQNYNQETQSTNTNSIDRQAHKHQVSLKSKTARIKHEERISVSSSRYLTQFL